MVNLITPGAGVSCFLCWDVAIKSCCETAIFSSLGNGSDKLYIVMMTREGSSKMVNFLIQEAGVLLQWGGGQEGRLKLCIILMTCINIQHIDCYCIKGL